MIVCRIYGMSRISQNQQLMAYLDSIEMEYETRTMGEGVSGVNPVTMFVIKSENKEDIKRISRNTNIPTKDFMFM